MSATFSTIEERVAALEIDLKVLTELVGFMSEELTPAQRDNVRTKQQAKIRPQHEIIKLVGLADSKSTGKTAQTLLDENAARIKLTLA